MANENVEDNGMDMNAILLEVLNSESAFGMQMRDKISSTLDVITKKMQQGAATTTFKSGPVTIVDMVGVDDAEQAKSAAAMKTQQNKIMQFIKDVSKATNWKNLKSGVNITDLMGSDKIQNQRFAKQYQDLQKKILAAVKANIPSKIDTLPQASEEAIEKPKSKKPTKENVEDETEMLADDKKDVTPSTSAFDANADTEDDADGDMSLGNAIKIAGEFLKSIMRDCGIIESHLDSSNWFLQRLDYESLETNNLIGQIIPKLDTIVELIGNMGGDDSSAEAGREAFQEDKGITIAKFHNDALKQIMSVLPKSAKPIAEQAPEKQKDGLFKTIFKLAGITALAGLFTYLAKNPEKWDKIKKWFKDTFVPFLKSIPKWFEEKFMPYIITELPKKWKSFKDGIKGVFAYFNDQFINLKKGFSEDYKVTEDTADDFLSVVRRAFLTFPVQIWYLFRDLGRVIGEFAYFITEKFIGFGEAIGEGAQMIWDFVVNAIKDFGKLVTSGVDATWKLFDDKIFKPFKDFAQSVWDGIQGMMKSIKDTILAIPKFVTDKLNEIKSSFLSVFTKTDEEKAADLQEDIVKAQLKLAKQERKRDSGGSLFGNDDKKIAESKQELAELIEQLKELNKATGASDVANDFISRDGKIQKFSNEDVVIGAKDKIIIENKNLDLQMHNLASIMELMNRKFDELIGINAQMLTSSGSKGPSVAPLPAISDDISTDRPIARDEALRHKTRAWEYLHGIA